MPGRPGREMIRVGLRALVDRYSLDLVVANAESAARLYENRAPRRGHWLGVRAIDPQLGRDAIGAQIIVEAGGRQHRRFVRTSAGYQASQPATAHFGLGPTMAIDRMVVRWPQGDREAFTAACVDCTVEIRRGEGAAAP